MDNKIIIGLIKKDIEEIKILLDAIESNPSDSEILVNICQSKANTLSQEIALLSSVKSTLVNEISEKQVESELFVAKPEESLQNADAEKIQKEEMHIQNENVEDKDDALKEKYSETQTIEEVVADDKDGIEVVEKQEHCEEPAVYDKAEAQSNEKAKAKVLGEKFSSEPSLNERFSSLANKQTKFAAKPILNLKKAIGINDRFLYTRELFENNMSKFEETVDVIDNSDGLLEAISYLEQNFMWKKNEISLKFIDLVKRRFNN